MPLSRRSAPSAKGSETVSLSAFGAWAKSYPALCEFLSSSTYTDGSSRELGTLTLSCRDGRLLASLNDKAASLYCFVSGDTLDALLKSSCRAIEDPEADWRVSQPFKAQKGRRA